MSDEINTLEDLQAGVGEATAPAIELTPREPVNE